MARPRAKTIIARVTMKGWSRKRATSAPEAAPAATPSASTAAIAAAAPQPSGIVEQGEA